jgi:hypothetical protein
MPAISTSLLLSFALTTSSPVLPVAWQSDMLVCTGTAFQTIETVASAENYVLVLDDSNAGIIVTSFHDKEIDRDIFLQFVFRKSQEQPKLSFLSISVRTLDGVEVSEAANRALESIQNQLLSRAASGKCV